MSYTITFRDFLDKWAPSRSVKSARVLQSDVLTVERLEELQQDVFCFVVLLIVCKKRGAADTLIQGFFEACAEITLSTDSLQSLCLLERNDLIALPVRLKAKANECKPQDEEGVLIDNPDFFRSWTGMKVLLHLGRIGGPGSLPPDGSYDRHTWKTSDDPWDCAVCARLLCQVPAGQIPARENIEEAFDAVDKLFTELLGKEKPENKRPLALHYQVFPFAVYFQLAIALGKADGGRNVLRRACGSEDWAFNELMELPVAYDLLGDLVNGSQLPLLDTFSTDAADSLVKSILDAVAERQRTGRQDVLQGVPMKELLERYAKAAFRLKKVTTDPEEPVGSVEDVLLPSATEEEIQQVEEKLGPLPPDLKEMARVASGFRGGWHFAGGGFAGIGELDVEPASENETWLDIEPVIRKVEETIIQPDGSMRTVIQSVIDIPNSTGTDWGPVWISFGAVECDGYTHVICPPETWRKIQGKDYKEGEYRVTYYSHWGGTDGDWKSMRHWIAELTADLEKEIVDD